VRRNLPNSNDPVAIAFGRDVFVAVTQTGTGNRVLTSNDGITWVARTTPANNTWQDVAYGNGVFVAVASSGTGNRIMTSPDGITWTARAFRDTTEWKCVSFLNGKFFIGGYSATSVASIASSTDGITWTNAAGSNLFTCDVVNIAYGNGIYFALSKDGNIGARSTDGNLWTVVSAPFFNGGNFQDICFHKGSFFAVNFNGGLLTDPHSSIIKSQDGINWSVVETREATDFSKDYSRIISVNGYLVLIPITINSGQETNIFSSQSGASFKKNKIESLQHFGTNFNFGKACFACGHLVVPIFNTAATTYTAKIASVKI
jgi:hypothetical protein